MSFPRLDFETDLSRELTRIGATASEAQAYLEGVRRGGALALATGSDGNMDDAARIMNLYSAIKTEELTGTEPIMPAHAHLKRPAPHDSPVMAGRTSHAGGGACLFVW
jgi:hypothetical protein